MSCDLASVIDHEVRAFESPLWFARQGLLRGRRAALPRNRGWTVLYRGETAETVDYEAPVGMAGAGAATIREWPTCADPTLGDGTRTYVVAGVGPGGVETEPPASAYTEVEFEDGVPVNPAPAAPLSIAVQPHVGGTLLCTVVVDQTLGRVPAAHLVVYSTTSDYLLSYATPYPLLPLIPVPAGGRQVVRFIHPSYGVQRPVCVAVRARSAAGAEEQNTTVLAWGIEDADYPPPIEGLTVECVR
jgi:hypothetical protein